MRRRNHFPRLALVRKIVRARVQHNLRQLLFAHRRLRHDDQPLLRKQVADRSRLAQVPVVLHKCVPNLAYRPILVVGQHLYHDGDAPRAVALVHNLLVRQAFELTRAPLDRPLDVVGRHIFRFGRQNRRPQTRVSVRIAAGFLCCNRDFLDEARKYLAALGVGRALLVLDRRPLRMPGHDASL